ncbi:nucleotidyltransferase family protein [Paenibacillus wynnii]|uniref:Renal dipeptidase n=1 Tax=Paenibacillus wynnii TaxID=268407 RepID=A0A098M9V7_9BACL|nr:nucleotidyltransferase family protein [Paenibacillus wynnii]KGE19334.1 Renal dipeptidase [Paenibacillus wynnii]
MGNALGLSTGTLSKEMRLLIAFLAEDHNPNDLPESQPELFRETDWEIFIELARHHRVYPYLYGRLKPMNEIWVPTWVVRTMHDLYTKNTFQMLHLSGEMEQVGKLFAEHDIDCLFLKGPVIAKDLYGDISLRTSCDLDLILSIEDLSKAEEILLQQGYLKDDYIRTVLNDWKWRHHHIVFFHSGKGIKVELHWRLNPAPSKEPAFPDLWKRRRTSSLTKHPIYYLGREDLFLFLVSHGARHGWSRIRWLLDIKQLLLQPLTAPKLIALLRKHHYYYIGGQALALTSSLLSVSIDSQLQPMESTSKSRRLAQEALFYLERMVNLHSPPIPPEVESYHKRHQFALLTFSRKFLFVLSFLFPYPEDAETLPLPKSLHFLYVPLRPILWAWRKTIGGQG